MYLQTVYIFVSIFAVYLWMNHITVELLLRLGMLSALGNSPK